ncbi:hypothetical protein J1605_013866, partial [Eschrichtius robustus]
WTRPPLRWVVCARALAVPAPAPRLLSCGPPFDSQPSGPSPAADMPRVYIGRLSYNVREKDIQRFFSGYGRLLEIDLKNGYGFVEFEDSRDADDAVYELNGKELCGERVIVEHARGPRRDRDGYSYGSRSGGGGYSSRRTSGRDKYGPPVRTEFRLIVENLSSRCSWQDLKDFMRQAGEVTYADAHKERTNEGVIEFRSYSDMKRALDKLDGTEINGRNIRLIEDKPRTSHRRSYSGSRSRSRSRRRSRSRSRRSSRSRSRSISKSRSRSRSRSKGRSRSRSKGRKSRSKSKSKPKSDRGSRSRSRSRSKDEYEKSRSRPTRMEGHAEIEMLGTLKGPSTGEVSVHLVARDSPGSGSHLPAAAFIIPASSATLGLPSSALDVSCFPREQIHVGTPERVAGSVPVTATVLPQLSTGPAASPSTSTVRLLEWTEAAGPPSRSGLRFQISEYAPPNMVGAEQPPSPELRREGVAEYEDGEALAGGSDAGPQQPEDLPQDPPEDNPQDPPEDDDGTCQCQECGPQQGAGPDPGASNDGCPQLFQERSVIVENSSGQNNCTSASELLKPMKKRKHREYQSLSEEESEPEAMEKQEEGKDPEGQPTTSTPESEEWNSSQPASGEKKEGWSWESYLEEQEAITAPVSLFQDYQAVTHNKNGFKPGMKLEGIDPQHPSMYFILTVAEVCGYRLRLHFDGYSECHDFWINASSPDIHPAGWFEKTGHKLQPPKGYKEEEFSWSHYLRSTRTQAAPKHLFVSQSHSPPPLGFQVGMKLEAVDRMNPSLICVASVTDVVDSRFLVHFDNWDDTYDYW